VSEYKENLDRLRELTARLGEANTIAGHIYFERRRAMRDALNAGCHPEAVAKACDCTISAVRIAERLPEEPLPRMGHSDPGDLVTVPEDASEASPTTMPTRRTLTARPGAVNRGDRRRMQQRIAGLVTQHDGPSDRRRNNRNS
jgi:hypothetical protein